MSNANAKQVGGTHYKKMLIEHWDLVSLFGMDYFQAQITRYVLRWRDKNGIEDLEKTLHYAQKYLEVEKLRSEGRLTRHILEATMARLKEQEDRCEPPTHVDVGHLTADIVQLPRRFCDACQSVMPNHTDDCPNKNNGKDACELCGGVVNHLPTCPQQR